ncbi:MAG: 30S ribosomal protein S20 [Acidobacteria bacterium]|nr:MAG: 30S ribosomal protein S20 [Acidobacteriota bacterium]PIE90745.1 MAG: 30S ribosomal protein S20 [Acidobacteriota bacterium]
MANHKSALKKAKQDIIRRTRNRSGKSKLRTALKKFRIQLKEKDQAAVTALPGLMALIDKSANKGFIHRNAAARLKSRLSSQTNAIQA